MSFYPLPSLIPVVDLLALIEGLCWARTAERQTYRLRRKYLHAVLRQDVGFFDKIHGASMTSQVVSGISTDSLTIQAVFTEKVPTLHHSNL